MRILFMGTPQFAVPTLQAILAAGHDVAAVFTQPDRPKGRGGELAQSPVKQAALESGVIVHQPERIRRPENVELIRDLEPDLAIVVGYGQIIPQSIIDIPRAGILNVHASLLPHYRGAAPIQWAIANGEVSTGVTIMQINAGLDTGDMLARWKTAIGPEETAPELGERLSIAGGRLLVDLLPAVASGTLHPEKQDDARASYAPILKKEDGQIVWTRTANEIYNRLRGFTPWPGAYSIWRGQQFQIVRARPVTTTPMSPATPGMMYAEKQRLFVICGGDTVLELHEVQPQSKKRMAAASFLNGYSLKKQEVLGDTQ